VHVHGKAHLTRAFPASKRTEPLLSQEKSVVEIWKKKYSELEKQKDSALAAETKRLQDAHQGESPAASSRISALTSRS
jgi:hypothetical protein